MWMIDPRLMCNKHLCGEHVECHMFVGAILKNKNLNGYIKRGLLEVRSLKSRHDVLAEEMKNRGMKHVSELKDFEHASINICDGVVNNIVSIKELNERCIKCRDRINKYTI